MSIHKLDFEPEYDFEVFGISCHLRDFRLAWLLNKTFHWDLIRESINIQERKNQADHSHVAFRYRNENEHLQYILIANRGKDGIIQKKLNQFDYFLFAEGYLDMFDAAACQASMNQLRDVNLVQKLSSDLFEKIQFQLFEAD